jgi:hypothetical protein
MDFKQTNLEVLATRIARLESQNHRWKWITSMVFPVGACLFLIGAKSTDRTQPPLVRVRTVEAQQLVLEDEAGHIHARLSLDGDPDISRAALRFYDEQGRLALTVPATPLLVPAK